MTAQLSDLLITAATLHPTLHPTLTLRVPAACSRHSKQRDVDQWKDALEHGGQFKLAAYSVHSNPMRMQVDRCRGCWLRDNIGRAQRARMHNLVHTTSCPCQCVRTQVASPVFRPNGSSLVVKSATPKTPPCSNSVHPPTPACSLL